jgi:hypothetical protein
VIHQVSHEVLDDLVDLWHEGTWPELELEDVIRAATDWSHESFDRWVATGCTPHEPLPQGLGPERSFCGHEKARS